MVRDNFTAIGGLPVITAALAIAGAAVMGLAAANAIPTRTGATEKACPDWFGRAMSIDVREALEAHGVWRCLVDRQSLDVEKLLVLRFPGHRRMPSAKLYNYFPLHGADRRSPARGRQATCILRVVGSAHPHLLRESRPYKCLANIERLEAEVVFRWIKE